MEFCGIVSCAFPNTATVEADFSILKLYADKYKRSLKLDTLNGALQSAQYAQLVKLANLLPPL